MALQKMGQDNEYQNVHCKTLAGPQNKEMVAIWDAFPIEVATDEMACQHQACYHIFAEITGACSGNSCYFEKTAMRETLFR